MIEECPEYENERETLIIRFYKIKTNIYQNIKFINVVLYSYHFEEKIKNLNNEDIKDRHSNQRLYLKNLLKKN